MPALRFGHVEGRVLRGVRAIEPAMTQAIEVARSARRAGDARVIALVSSAHFASHYFMLLLPPLFPFVRAEFGVSYTGLGLALAVFNMVSAALQTPAGFLADRIGAATMLLAGLVCSAVAFGLAAIVHSFWFLVAMFGVAGLGNTTYHPADYAILSHHVHSRRMGSAYSIHTFAGMLGGAVAPASLLLLEHRFGWRGAFMSATVLGGVVALALLLQRDALAAPAIGSARSRVRGRAGSGSWRLLIAPALLRNLMLFVLLALVAGGLQNYSVVSLVALHGTRLPVADAALAGYLLLTALGVLLGGLIAGRTVHHDLIAILGLAMLAVAIIPVALFDLGAVALIAVMSAAGLASGLIMPSRDMIVRAVAPPGAFGAVFGFVTTGFNIGGIIAPLLFGWVMDHGYPRSVFVLSGGFCLVSILVLATEAGPAVRRRAVRP
jgi:MFS transporter, FSR family, fosmidomycin resistance protein